MAHRNLTLKLDSGLYKEIRIRIEPQPAPGNEGSADCTVLPACSTATAASRAAITRITSAGP
jgi:hypothetical protein